MLARALLLVLRRTSAAATENLQAQRFTGTAWRKPKAHLTPSSQGCVIDRTSCRTDTLGGMRRRRLSSRTQHARSVQIASSRWTRAFHTRGKTHHANCVPIAHVRPSLLHTGWATGVCQICEQTQGLWSKTIVDRNKKLQDAPLAVCNTRARNALRHERLHLASLAASDLVNTGSHLQETQGEAQASDAPAAYFVVKVSNRSHTPPRLIDPKRHSQPVSCLDPAQRRAAG